jgi:VanZ family protein
MIKRSMAWRGAFWLCALMVLLLALMPAAPTMPGTGWDKSNHLLAFAVLGALGFLSYPGRVAWLLLALLAYGGLIEVLQWFTPGRFAEWTDWLADAVGLIIGVGVAGLLRKAVATQRSKVVVIQDPKFHIP